MMNNLKKELKSAFEAPAPTRKNLFLKHFNYPKASRFDFIKSQLGYIRKRIWFLSAFLFIAILLALYFHKVSISFVWVVSSTLPFISLISISEIVRSIAYNMQELEMSCRHNLLEVVLVRLGILGVANFIVLISVVLLFVDKTDLGFFRLGLYLITPFLLNCYGSLFVINRSKSRETTYICGCVTAFVSLLNALLTVQVNEVYAERHWLIWAVSFILLAVLSIREATRLIKKMEELEWSLSLTA